jgi:hypothetical protein
MCELNQLLSALIHLMSALNRLMRAIIDTDLMRALLHFMRAINELIRALTQLKRPSIELKISSIQHILQFGYCSL